MGRRRHDRAHDEMRDLQKSEGPRDTERETPVRSASSSCRSSIERTYHAENSWNDVQLH
jgi:hypothetical protein